ncbi:MAG: tetratricopeptide repeat protein [Polyangiaceae bacterium]|nr:tetratricopeptide repeat protein [Polyangiaceae bacterium]
MSAKTIRSALGILQDEADNETAWADLRKDLGLSPEDGSPGPAQDDLDASELAQLLRAARTAHESRREYEAVARLLEIEADLASGETQVELLRELARVRGDVLLDDAGALEAERRLLALVPNDAHAAAAIDRSNATRGKWREVVARYVAEAEATSDTSFRSSLLASAAEIAYRFGRPVAKDAPSDADAAKKNARSKKSKKAKARSKDKGEDRRAFVDDVVARANAAIAIDPQNQRAVTLLERVLYEEERWEDLAKVLTDFAETTSDKDDGLAALVRLSRVLRKKLGADERAIAAYERILHLSPGHAEATRGLVDIFTERGMWDYLVALYNRQLEREGLQTDDETGIIFQIAMVHWRMRGRPDDAEPYFERLRKVAPAHPGVLAFFREWCRDKGATQRLIEILTDAERALPEGDERTHVAAEISDLSDEGTNSQKAIEQWRAALRTEPNNAHARAALKRLYRQTGAYNQLADLLRADLERVPAGDAAARLPLLREIETIYRDHIKSDSALVSVLTQIIALDAHDAAAVRELARVYETLGRFRDLLTTQTRLAELEGDPDVKAELYRAIARRWLDQFTNVQNAVDAYEKLRELKADDAEAHEKLRELYTKRRSYRQLYDLLEAEARKTSGAPRRALYAEMAKLAAERLDRGADAVRLYKEILVEDPTDTNALDALEKQAERDKDFATVAEALEMRVASTTEPSACLVVLQKLGGIYTDRLQDHPSALRTWRRVLDLSPSHAKALRILRDAALATGDYDGVTEFYAKSNDWEGLVEVLSTAADRATDPLLKIDLSYRAADVLETKLNAPGRTLRAYERVLLARPDDRRAAAALIPLYEADEKWARVPALYEVLLLGESSEAERRAIFHKLAVVYGQRLDDQAAAFFYAVREFQIAPSEPGAVHALEQWAQASGDWNGFLRALEARAHSKDASEIERRALGLKLAEVSASRAGRIDDAIAIYRDLISANPNDGEAITALDRLLRGVSDRHDDLRWLFRMRADRADVAARVWILAEWARFEEEAFGSADRAIALYREILEIEPGQLRALGALGRLLLASGDVGGAASVLMIERDLETGPDRVAREVEIARLAMGPMNKPEEALAAARRALEIAPNDLTVIAVVEELLPIAETRAQAAVVLEQAYEATGAWDKQADVLGVLIATAASKRDRLVLQERLADVKVKLDDHAAAFDTIVRAALENPTEMELWDRLAVLANKTHRTAGYVEAITQVLPEHGESGLLPGVETNLAERAATLYDDQLGEIDRAAPYLERILSHEPTNERAFNRLKQILTTRERWTDLENLYERVIDATENASRRADLLAEVALVAEEITGDANRAIHDYERILAIEPAHAQAISSLDKLYFEQERWQNLADLLQRRLALASGSDSAHTTELKLRLGTVLFTKLADPRSALQYLEEVVREDANVREARELIEKCLAHPDLRERAAIILEGVYAEREELRDLVRVLQVRLEFCANDAERREFLRRIAELYDGRLHDDAGAFDTYARLLPLSPDDAEARQRYLEIAKRQGRLGEAADLLLSAAKNAEAPQPRAEILSDVAKIYEEHQEADRAEAVHRQVVDLAPDDLRIALPAARALERLYTSASNKSRELADVLRIQVKLEESVALRRDLIGRLAGICEDVLNDDAAAVAAWKMRIDDDPSDEQALSALDRLYERTADHRALVEVLRAREKRAESGEARKALMVRGAQVLGDRLGDVPEAIVAYSAIVDDFGADRPVLDALAALYEKDSRWHDLVDTLETELGLMTSDEDRVATLVRLGDLRKTRLGNVPSSIEAYRQALTLDPDHVPARAALEELLDDEDVRGDVAEILRPLYETSGLEAKLVRVLDIQIGEEQDLHARLDLLAHAADVTENSLGDPARAFGYAARGLRESAAEPSMPVWIERATRLTDKTGDYSSLVEVFCDVVKDVPDEERHIELLLRIADLARTKLSDAALAKRYYRSALDVRGDDARALSALEQLYEEAGEHELLLEILQRRAELAGSDTAKREILYKKARICADALGDVDRAIGVYEEILELGLDAPAIAALEKLYRERSRWGDLVALHEWELSTDGTPRERRAALHHALGSIFDKDLGEIDRAFDSYGAALREEPAHEATISSLEELMAHSPYAGRAAEMLEAVYVARHDWRKMMAATEARLAHSEDHAERRSLLQRLAKLHEEEEKNVEAALDITAKLLHEDVTDTATWSELERLARAANKEERLAEIFATELDGITSDEPATARLAQRTGELYEAQKDDARALAFYRRAYAFSPEDGQDAFVAIDRILTRKGSAADRVALYRGALEYRVDSTERLRTLSTIAEIEEKDLSDDDAAIATLRSILELDEADKRAPEALVRLFTRRERFRDLADLYRRRAEQSALPEEEASFRFALARVLDERLAETSRSIDELEIILGLVSPQESEEGRQAVAMLESMLGRAEHTRPVAELLRPIYEKNDDWRKIVDTGRFSLAVATAPHEKVAILREAAHLHEQRGNDLDTAFVCLKEAFVLDPDDGVAREELDRVAALTKRWDDLADAYQQGLAKIDGVGQKELLASLAKLHDERRDDPRSALDAYDELFRLDESDDHPLGEMDQLATLLSDWSTLVRVLVKRAELTNDDEERARFWRRVGEARRDMLDDAPGAIDAYERALELEPTSAFTIDNLIEIYEEKHDAARLVELYKRRLELCGEDDGELRHRLLLDAATCYETGLSDRREAIQLLNEALANKPEDREILERLGGLYEAERMWVELLDNLRAQASVESDATKKLLLVKRMGRLLAGELGDHQKALEAYRDVLSAGYDEEAANAILALGEAHDELRVEAADVLEVATANGPSDDKTRNDLCARTLEMRLRAQTDPAHRAATRLRIAEVAEKLLGDLPRAEAALAAALADTPADASLHAEMERIAERLGRDGYARYADVLAERATSIFDARVAADLFFRLGKIAEDKLGDLDRAAGAYAHAAEQGGDTEEVLSALERVHTARNDMQALADVLERRIAIEADGSVQADLYHRLASLELAIGDKKKGVSTFRLALEKKPDHDKSRLALEELLGDDELFEEAFATLEEVYRATNMGTALGRLYARPVERATGAQQRTRARLALARVLEADGADPISAQRTVEAAVVEDPDESDAIAELERLADKNGAWASAADALGRGLEGVSGVESSRTSLAHAELWARLGRWRRDSVHDAGGAETAFKKALDGDPENIATLRAWGELIRTEGRERDRIDILRRLVRLEGEPEVKRALAREAVELAENVVGDTKLAEAVLRDLLIENEIDTWANEELTRLREQAGDYAQVVELLLRRAENESDGLRANEFRHRAADVAASKLGDFDRAAYLYEEILEREPGDTHAQGRLRVLYAELGKPAELAKLLRMLIDGAGSEAERSALRIDLAVLELEMLHRSDAIDLLRAVLEENPDHEEAVNRLSSLFKMTGQSIELAELHGRLVSRARERGDAGAELTRMLQLGKIFEDYVNDATSAMKVYDEVLERDATNQPALEAAARIAEARENWEKVADALSRLLQTVTGNSAVALALRLAAARAKLGQDDGVEQALCRALSEDPKHSVARAQLEELYARTKNWAKLAGLLVGDAGFLSEDNPPYEPPESRSETRPSTIPPSRSTVPPPPYVAQQVSLLRRAAEIHLRERSAPEEAIPLLERATNLVPRDRELLLMLCDAYGAAKQDRDASKILERVIASFGNKRTKELSLYHHRLGRTLASLGDRDVALAQLDMAFKIDPGSVEVLRDLGVLALEANDLERAQKTFRALLLQRLDAHSGITKGEVFYYLGMISMKQGDKAKAVQMLERALENEPTLERAKALLSELKK